MVSIFSWFMQSPTSGNLENRQKKIARLFPPVAGLLDSGFPFLRQPRIPADTMGRIGLAFQTFFGILFKQEVADKVSTALSAAPPRLAPVEAPPPPPAPPKPRRSEAITLLETLQREARFLDFIQESLDSYDDAQIGGAVREVHRGCQGVLKRCFTLQPVVNETEGTVRQVTSEDDPGRIRLTGNVPEARPVRGEVVHSGWLAGKCDLPQWIGTPENHMVIAPAEVEVR